MSLATDKLRSVFVENDQEHVFSGFSALSITDQEAFKKQLSAVDIEELNSNIKYSIVISSLNFSLIKYQKEVKNSKSISPFLNVVYSDRASTQQLLEWRSSGLNLIKMKQIGIILLAGGQGTRLGSSNPKGMYDIGLGSHRTLFKLQAERIQRLRITVSSLFNLPINEVSLPWYIMTSEATHNITIQYFENEKFFNLPKDDIYFFKQGVQFCIDEKGKLMLESSSKLAQSPDGNGGLFFALKKHGILSNMQTRGIKAVFVYGIDNVLVKVADPVFIGYCHSNKLDIGNKVVDRNPGEKVGVMCLKKDKANIIEYTEIPKEMNEAKVNNQLLFGLANIVQHYFTIEVLETAALKPLPFHIAHKKIPYHDFISNSMVKPDKPNGYKFERFVFEVFPFSDKVGAFCVNRNFQFSPVKNASAPNINDSPETALRDIRAYFMHLFNLAGGQIRTDDIHPLTNLELSFLLSYDEFDLDILKSRIEEKPTAPTYLY